MSHAAHRSLLPLEQMSATADIAQKLALVERVQGNRDWLVTISAHNNEEVARLGSLKQELDQGNYSSYMDTGAEGLPVLRVHHLGRQTTVLEGVDKLGIAGGLRLAGQNIVDPILDATSFVGTVGKDIASEPARRLAGLYQLGDTMYMLSGFTEKGDDFNLKKGLKSYAGLMGTLQSVIFMRYARDSSEFLFGDMQAHIKEAIEQGQDPYEAMLEMSPEHSKKAQGVVGKIDEALKKNPIDIGSACHITGQLALILSGGIRFMETRNEGDPKGLKDIARASLSIAGWLMLSTDEQPIEEKDKTGWTANPLQRIQQEIRQRPHVYAGVVTTMASIAGYLSSREQNDPGQAIAELTYLLGDATMFITRKAEYGDAAGNNTENAAKAAATFIEQSPVIFSETELTQFVHTLSDYLSARIVEERLADGSLLKNSPSQNASDLKHDDVKAEAIADVTQSLKEDIFTQLSGKERKIGKVANAAARIVSDFPLQQRDHLIDTLSHHIATRSGVQASTEDVRNEIHKEQEKFVQHESPLSPPSMSVVSGKLSDLVLALPDINAAHNASTLYDIVSEHTRSSPLQGEIFNRDLQQKASENIGIPMRDLKQQSMAETYARN